MIEVRHLTKRYGAHTAVADVSFTIEKGVIYGFLGPNGAGKSTTMNIITGCLGASEGEVLVDGHNIMDEPLQAKKLIGYLPELPPLYMDMTPREYLHFVMRAKGVPRKERAAQYADVIAKARIEEMQDRLIRNLSKGYRQRVGIAEALLGNPEVIILDEPTVGLDPAQIIEIRDLIRELGKEHTIILSSHILSEVQAVCEKVLIISNGVLVASDTTANLTAMINGAQALRLEVKGTPEEACEVLNGVEGAQEREILGVTDGVTAIELKPADGADLREALFCAFAEAKLPLLEMARIRASLEDVFLELTGQDAQDNLAPLPEENSVKEDEAE